MTTITTIRPHQLITDMSLDDVLWFASRMRGFSAETLCRELTYPTNSVAVSAKLMHRLGRRSHPRLYYRDPQFIAEALIAFKARIRTDIPGVVGSNVATIRSHVRFVNPSPMLVMAHMVLTHTFGSTRVGVEANDAPPGGGYLVTSDEGIHLGYVLMRPLKYSD